MDIKAKWKNGSSIADLARETGYCEKTIRKWLKSDEAPKYKPRAPRPSKLDPYKDYIMNRMADGVFNCELLYEEIVREGYTGGKTILKDFVAPFRKQFRIQAVRRFETKPGEQAQCDWGYLGAFELDGRLRKVWLFVMVLGYSRILAAHGTTSMDLESLLLCHEKAFEAFGGVTRQVVYDNMKTVTLGRDTNNRPMWQSRFLDFATYYDFQPVLCSPRKPRSKGKVEAAIGYIKKNFCPGRSFTDLTDLNNQLQKWLQDVANVRIHGTTGDRPVDRLWQENLQPLPDKPFPTAVRFERRVSRDCFFSYEGVLYSVPWPYAGGTVDVEETVDGYIHVWWHGEPVAVHEMPKDGRRRVEDPQHLTGLAYAQSQGQSGGLRQCFPEVQERPLSEYDALAEVTR